MVVVVVVPSIFSLIWLAGWLAGWLVI